MPYSHTHLACQLGGADDIVAGPRSLAVHEDLFRAASTHQDGKLRIEIVFRDRMLVFLGQVHGHAQRHAARMMVTLCNGSAW